MTSLHKSSPSSCNKCRTVADYCTHQSYECCMLLSSTSTIAIYYYSAHKLTPTDSDDLDATLKV